MSEAERTCGVWAVDIRNGKVVAFVKFEEAVQEIFAVSVLAGCEFPDLINDDPKITGSSFVLPDDALAAVPESFRSNQPAGTAPEKTSREPLMSANKE